MSDLWDGPRMMATKADQITPTKPEWLWEQWLVAGALHVLVSRQGFGKSTLAAWLTGQVTTGRGYPDDPTVREPSNVATLSLEEAADRLVARLRATGADVGRVDILADVQDDDDDGRTYRRPWRLPKDCSVLESFIRDGQIRLLIVDGLGYSITGDSHNYAVVGSALSALAGVAESTGCAVLGLTHPPKGGSDPVTAAIGSAAWTAIPRIVWVLGVDPEDKTEQRRVCRVSKTNYRQPDNGIGFSIDNDERFECGWRMSLPSPWSNTTVRTLSGPHRFAPCAPETSRRYRGP
jgi:putative DNA primase/helicase